MRSIALLFLAALASVSAAPLGNVAIPTLNVTVPSTDFSINATEPWNASLPVLFGNSTDNANWTSFVNRSIWFYGNGTLLNDSTVIPSPENWLWLNSSWVNGTFGNATSNFSFPVAFNGSWINGNFSQYIHQSAALYFEDALASEWSKLLNSSSSVASSVLELLTNRTNWLEGLLNVNSTNVCGTPEAPTPPTQYSWGGDWFLSKDVYTINTDTSIASYLTYTDSFTNLSAYVSLFPELFNVLDNSTNVVLFAPNDIGFSALNSNLTNFLGTPAGLPVLENVLKYHTVVDASSDVLDVSKLPQNEKVCVQTAASAPVQLYTVGSRDLTYANDGVIVGKVKASNGVLYVIQQVLSPLFYANNSLEAVNVTAPGGVSNVTKIVSDISQAVNTTLNQVVQNIGNVKIPL